MFTSRRTFHLGLLSGAATLALSGQAQATTVLALTLEEMVSRTSKATVATAVHHSSDWIYLAGSRRIVTFTRLVQEDDLLDESPTSEELVIMTLGGKVGSLRQKIPGEAELPLGERALIFATPEQSDGTRRVVGMAQGRFSIEEDEKQQVIRPSRFLPHLVRSRKVGAAPPPTAMERLDGKSLAEARELVRGLR